MLIALTKTPSEIYIERGIKELEKSHKMQKELDKYGRDVPAGKMWTVGDMQAYFRDFDAKKRKRRK